VEISGFGERIVDQSVTEYTFSGTGDMYIIEKKGSGK
jgi:hypothetical protein